MTAEETTRKVVENMFKAMQAGLAGEEDMMALFSEVAVFVEPFGGAPKTHTGKEAIRKSFRDMWANPTPDMKLHVDRIDVDGDQVRAEWTCTSPVFPTPMKGHDLFRVHNGLIAHLEIVVTDMPDLGE